MTALLAPSGTGTAASGPHRVLLVDDRPLMRAGLSAILADEPGCAELRQVDTVAAAVHLLRASTPPIVVVAAHLAGPHEWTELAAAAPASDLIALGALPVRLPSNCGRLRSLPETADAQQICAAIRASTGSHRAHSPARRPAAGLTPQEDRILGLIGDGLTNREIADRLGIAEKTVKNYITGLFSKIHVTRRTHAAAVAWRRSA